MPTYKLIYFEARGGAEVSRFIFAYAGVQFEDVRIKYSGEEWQQLKPNTPFGVLPVLEEDGNQLGGSIVIARHLAERHGLGGKNALENAQIANVVDAVSDFNQEMMKVWFEKDETRKADVLKKLKEEKGPKTLQLFEKRAATNDHGWIHAGRLTWADFFLYQTLGWALELMGSDALGEFPSLKKLKASVEALPPIAEWIKNRPVTEY